MENNRDRVNQSWMTRQFEALVGAIRFLTRIPVGAAAIDHGLRGASLVYFPVVGLIVGSIGAAVYVLAGTLWNYQVGIAIAMMATIVATGAFHEDGLADTADGLGGGWSREDKLRIMKDSVIGTYGSVALLMAVLTKFVALSSLAPGAIPAALICGHVVGRWSTLPLLRYCSYIGGEQGSGSTFSDLIDDQALIWGTVLTWVLVLICVPAGFFATFFICSLVLYLSRLFLLRKLGGITGDTLGACNQLLELTVYLIIAAHFS